jgi:ubiquinone/menaquinone biosynthesis C-methylase UbiE
MNRDWDRFQSHDLRSPPGAIGQDCKRRLIVPNSAPKGEGEGHRHGHHRHEGHHHRPDGFDWDTLADSLELDATITMPIVEQVLRSPIVAAAEVIHDVGCGPGVVAVRLADQGERIRVTAIDASEPLLKRLEQRASAAGVGDRLTTVAADLEHPLPAADRADLVWVSMVLHHVADPDAALERLHDRLVSGGALVMVEFGDPPTVLPSDDPLRLDGTWRRFEAATSASLERRLGLDPVAVDWPSSLRRAGFVDVTDDRLTATHEAPLSEVARAWLARHILGGIEMAGDDLGAAEVDALLDLAESIPTRHDLVVVAERRVLTARRG